MNIYREVNDNIVKSLHQMINQNFEPQQILSYPIILITRIQQYSRGSAGGVFVGVLVETLVEAPMTVRRLRQVGNISLTQLWHTIIGALLSLDTNTLIVLFSLFDRVRSPLKSFHCGIF